MALGVIGVVASWTYWAPCVGEAQPLRDGLIDNERLTASCAALVESASIGAVPYLWLAAFILVMVAAAWNSRPWTSTLAVIPLIALFPVTAPGFFWQPWDTADIVPGSGVLPAAAIVVSGLILWASAAFAKAPSPERQPVLV